MLEIKRQRSFADGMVYSVIVNEDHLLYKINELADFSFVNLEMAQFYHERLGRIAIEPEILVRAMVGQYLYNWSDRVCADMVQNHIMVKWFVGLSLEQKGFDFTLLSKYRKLLREKDKERMVFDAIVKQLIEAGYISSREKVIMDATHLVADLAIPTATKLIRDGIEVVLEVAKEHSENLWIKAVKQVGLAGYLKEEDKKEYLLDAQQKAQRLNTTARDAWRLKEWMKREKKGGTWESEKMEKTLRLLEKVLEDYVEEEGPDEPPPPKKRGRSRKGNRKKKKRGRKKFKQRKKKGAGRLVSFKDDDARWGAKSDKKTFAGYKVHTMENENQLVLDTQVTPGNVSDDAPVIAQIEKAEEKHGIKVAKLTGDTKYGTGAIREKLSQNGAQVVAPLSPPTNKKGYYTNDNFTYNETADCVVCPAGKRSEKKVRNNKNRCYIHSFPAHICNTCSRKNKCTESDRGRSVSVSDFRTLFEQAAEYNTTDSYKQDMKIRAHIEPKQWEMKHPHGLGRVKYRGLDRVDQQAANVAAVVNLKRWVKLHNSTQSTNAPKNDKHIKVAQN